MSPSRRSQSSQQPNRLPRALLFCSRLWSRVASVQTHADLDAYHNMRGRKARLWCPCIGVASVDLSKGFAGLTARVHSSASFSLVFGLQFGKAAGHLRGLRVCGNTCFKLASPSSIPHAGYSDDRAAGPLEREILEKLASGEPRLKEIRCLGLGPG